MRAGAPHIAILGSGMAGMGACHRLRALGLSSIVYDRNSYPGGHTASHRNEGFVFDEGPHVSFTKNEEFRRLLSESVRGDYRVVSAAVNNYWKGHWIRHPAITNLYGLPSDLIVRILLDFIESQRAPRVPIRHYLDWLVAAYGRSFAESFPVRYTVKYHTTRAENLSTDWLGPRLYQAKLEEVILGAIQPNSPNVHYVQDYRYPTQGGFGSYLRLFQNQSDIRLNHQVVRIDWQRRELTFGNGATATCTYDWLVSSVPLPDLIGMLNPVPADVKEAAQQLACTSVVLVNLGVDRPDVSSQSWTYFYDEEFPFSRVSFPRMMSPHTVPDGKSSIQAEVYYSAKYRPLDCGPEALIEPVIEGLRRCGVLRPDDRICFKQARLVPYANIIFDLDRAGYLAVVHGFLDSIGIRYCGRYGAWGYLWTDEAFETGEQAAQQIVDQISSPAGRGVAGLGSGAA
jgi:protoporphyrinogen oxidase